ncbi:protein of unknown function [Filimonas lacunae]|uniref:eCIS core domain-containing protein n=1 Tax=Filimonas lacunae TaxID=477680 RepID=A0A173MGH2_9BACT|nr:DUF4157 domain-containing protein [Filimonas lacunae]BAV06589.1 hypothetical protein FLA_2608 [Filimonas lacunae]SIT27494.1 protein of unknown function [Filimonas lacunae]
MRKKIPAPTVAPVTEATPVPPIAKQALEGNGKPLDTALRTEMEPRFGHDFSNIRIHSGDQATEAAGAVQAKAYTVGQDIVFGHQQYQPGNIQGRQLIAHELAHTIQQGEVSKAATSSLSFNNQHNGLEQQAHKAAGQVSGGPQKTTGISEGASPSIMRTPAAPDYDGVTAKYDRSKVTIDPIEDVVIADAKAKNVNIAMNDPEIEHLTWEIYGPGDVYITGRSTTRGGAKSTSSPFEVRPDMLSKGQGRYTLRCTARNKTHHPIYYADSTFYAYTTTPVAMMNKAGLKNITDSPGTHTFGEVGGAKARSMMLEHKESVAATGTGTMQGNRCGSAAPSGVTASDCTNYVLDVLKYTFNAQGRAADWTKVFQEAQKTSNGKFKGNELVKALISQAGWKAVFWAPDPRNPGDGKPEASVANNGVKKNKEYKSSNEKTGIPVDPDKSVIEYRRTEPIKQNNMTGIDKLHKIPLAVITARGGTHMTLLINGVVYEVHWDKGPDDPNVLEATPLEKWVWESGAIVMPAEDYNKAF